MDARRGAPACSLLAAALANAPRGSAAAACPAEGTELRRKYALASRTLSAQTRMIEELKEGLRARDAEHEAERVRCEKRLRMRSSARCLMHSLLTLHLPHSASGLPRRRSSGRACAACRRR